jgi:hypothetical protein
MAGRPAGSRRQPVFGRLPASGEKWSALTAAGGLACRCDSAGPGQARRLTGAAAANGIYQMIARRGRQAGVDAWTHRFRHHFSHTWLDRAGRRET